MEELRDIIKKQGLLLVIAFSFCASFLLFWLCYRYDNKYMGDAMQPINGILFLDQKELDQNPVRFLVNEWAVYDDILLSPEDFAGNGRKETGYPIPDRYMQAGTGSDTIRTGRTTYSLLLALPSEERAYTLEIPEIFSSYTLYANDVKLLSQSALRGGYDGERIQTGSITFLASGDTRLLLAVENPSYYYGGILSPPAFGKPAAVSALLARQLVFHTLLLSLAGFLALFFFLPGIYSRHPQRFLYAGLCLMFMGYTFHHVQKAFPYPLFLSGALELFCTYGMFFFLLLLAGRICTVQFPFQRALLTLGGVICILALAVPRLGGHAYLISEVLGFYKLVMAAALLAYAAIAARKEEGCPKSLLAGIAIFSASLFADRIWPLFEPVSLGWFNETAGACFILILGAILLMEAKELKNRQQVLEQSQALYQEQIARQEQHYETLVDQIERTKKARHDLRHHIVVLRQMLSDHREQEALEYLGQYEGSLNLSEKMVFSSHYKIDVILRYFYTVARENGIAVTIDTPLPERLHIAETNLCIVFANLLENALESCLKSRSEDRFIQLNTVLNRSQIVISMKNTVGGRPISCMDGFLSTKKPGRKGIGLLSIRNVAEQYGGGARFEVVNDTTFFSQVLLINQDTGDKELPEEKIAAEEELAKAYERERRTEAENKMLLEMSRMRHAFYTDMTHEMKTPLTVIAVNAQFAAQNIAAGMVDEETVADLSAISDEARRLAQMVSGFVEMGRMQTGDRLVSLASLLTETVRIYQPLFTNRGNILTMEVDPDLPPVEGSADQLVQVLINLLNNANRYTSGGMVTARAELLRNRVRVSITDNGEGIAPELLPHVFERFSRGDKGGSGLGLPVCKVVIEEYGGEIGIESEKGEGTTVWFTLPVREETEDEGNRYDPIGGG